ncbi:MAG: nicotinate-nucleotide--dimethylbenzimidazole phosphoribosyltransferase [Chloroflexota bacterium]
MTGFDEALDRIAPLDEAAMAAARDHLLELTKPPGSLGRLEELVVLLAGITGQAAPGVHPRAIIIAAADHGVAMRHAVSAYPAEVTAQMVANFAAGGAAIAVLAEQVGATLTVVDVGVASPVPRVPIRASAELRARNIRSGTRDMTEGPAMDRGEVLAAIEAGVEAAGDRIAAGARLIGIGEMGIGSTTAASAIVAVLTGRPVAAVTGRGTGVDEAGWNLKVATIERALEVNQPDARDPLGTLEAVGGLEIAALVGTIVGAAAERVPVVLDGFITGAAALVAARLQPAIAPRLIASHRSVERGHAIVLEALGLRPLLELDLRLGEATGAALAMPLLDAAVRLRDGMATFAEAGVSGPADVGVAQR